LLSRSLGASRFALAVKMRRMSAGVTFELRSSRSAAAAHLRSRDRRSGGQLIIALGCRHQDVDARRRDRNIFPAIGGGE
jgi:hypothetical protein